MAKVKIGAFQPLPVVPIVLVGAVTDGKPNYATVGFVNGVNVDPAIVCVSLNQSHHTVKGIMANNSFSLNIPSVDHVVQTDYCGLVSGREVDKSEVFTTFYGELETAPMIQEFPITCECRYTGQHVEFSMDTVYFGEVVQVYLNEEMLGANRTLDILKARPIYFSAFDQRYRALGEELGLAWKIGKHYAAKSVAGKPAF